MSWLVCRQALYDFSQRRKRQVDAFALGERVPRVGADSWQLHKKGDLAAAAARKHTFLW